jgi:hypothetical protein
MKSNGSGAGGLSRRKRLAGKLSLVLFGVLLGLAFAEVTLRVIGYTYPVFYTTDVDRGYALKPNMAGWYRKENDVYVRINSAGLRDREHTKAKPPNTIRIAVVGDSYAEALQVPMEKAFWFVMGEKLKECRAFGGRDVEVINFGVSGYGTAQELITLRKQVWDYSPDIVLLAVTTNNDISDNVRALKKTDEIPYFVLSDNRLVEDDSFRETKAFRLRSSTLNRIGTWLRDNLRFIQAVNQGHHALKAYIAARRAKSAAPQNKDAQNTAGAQNVPAASEELGVDNVVYRKPNDAVWNEAWRVTEALIRQMRDEVKSRGAKLVVVTLSNGIQAYPDPAGREAFMRRVGVPDLFYPDRRIKTFCEQESIPVITLAPALQSYAEQNRVFLHGFGKEIGNGHWNEHGHLRAGEMIAQELCRW